MTQEELAASANLSVRSIRKIEAGRVSRPRPSTLRALADAFELPEPARLSFYEAPAAPFHVAHEPDLPQPAPAPWSSTDHPGKPLVIVTIATATRQLDGLMSIHVHVRSDTGDYRMTPMPIAQSM